MLKLFSVSNFRIFKNQVTIDFTKVSDYDFKLECIEDNCVRTSIMYGDNASGKTSLAFALFDIVPSLTNKQYNINCYNNYLNNDSDNPYATFKYVFQVNGCEVTYEYKKTSVFEFISEKLTLNDKVLFDYDRTKNIKELYIDIPGTEMLAWDLSKIRISVLKYIKSNSVLENADTNLVLDNLFSFVENMTFFSSLDNISSIGQDYEQSNNIISKIVKDGAFSDLQDIFRETGFTDEIIHSNLSGIEELYIKYPNGKAVLFSHACSSGMKSLLLFFYWYHNIKTKGTESSFIFIDDFDAFYHFKLSRLIINKLIRLKCQVLVTTHKTSLMSSDILRPDCYYICSKDKILNLPNTTKKSIKVWHNLESLYKGGTFNIKATSHKI